MKGDIVAQGIELMLYGMGTVVIFLTLLVITTTLMSRGVSRFFPEPQAGAQVAAQKAAGDDSQLVAVISAAIHQHRSNKRR